MSGADDDWVKAAMTDDAMVAELLLRLRHAPPPPKSAVFPLEWSVRQRRSKSVSVNNRPKKPAHRASPTTPLSWSGATSFSGGSGGAGGGGTEESSRPMPFKLSSATRSKVNTDGEKTNPKRSRKKKTLAELKDEENLLLKERRELKREMVVVRMNLESLRARNVNFKRMKIEMQPHLASESTTTAEESVSGQPQQDSPASHPPMTPVVSCNDAPVLSNACPDENADMASDSMFILPDLNILFNEPTSDRICGIS